MSVMGRVDTVAKSRRTVKRVPAIAASAMEGPKLPLDTILQDDCVAAMASLPDACVDLVFAEDIADAFVSAAGDLEIRKASVPVA